MRLPVEREDATIGGTLPGGKMARTMKAGDLIISSCGFWVGIITSKPENVNTEHNFGFKGFCGSDIVTTEDMGSVEPWVLADCESLKTRSIRWGVKEHSTTSLKEFLS